MNLPPINWEEFRAWAHNRYAKSWAKDVFCYAKRYHSMMTGSLRELESFSRSKRNNVMKALIALSKYLGIYTQFKTKTENYGFKWKGKSSLGSFTRMMQAGDSDVLQWCNEAVEKLSDKEATFLKFVAISGIRVGEAIKAFNLVIELNQAGRLGDYYNRELHSLEHFKYPELFLRGTKNVFFSFIPQAFIDEITACETVYYSTLRKHLKKHGLNLRFSELRDYYATFLVHHGVIREEVDLLQGRIGQSIFMRHYFSPDIEALRDRVLAAITKLPVLT